MKKQLIKALFIEDDPDDILLLEELFAQASANGRMFELECADRLEAGLKRLAAGGIDILVLDLSLPDCRGIETVSRACAQSADIPVVVLTSSKDEKTAIEALSLGAEDYLVKGEVSGPLLIRTLRYAIERHRNKKELDHVNRELRASQEQLEKLIFLDPLTELLNRRGLQDVMERELQRGHREQTNFTILLIDLDNFKEINDTWGYTIGDTVLRAVAHRLKDSLRKTDVAARIGGDEFIIFLPETRPGEALRIAERVRLTVSGMPILLSGTNACISASIGVLTDPPVTSTLEELLAQAYPLLQQSKQQGKNLVVHSGQPKKRGTGRGGALDLSFELGGENVYSVLKQPIISLGDKQTIGYEFLSRSSIRGFEMPDEFLKIASENNLLTLVDHLCFKACVQASAGLPDNLRRHFNLFPSTILALSVEKLIEDIPSTAFRKSCCIEISEKQIVGEASHIAPQIKVWKKFGVRTALDDVGFGRSSLESLILLEPNVVKVDKRWVQGIHHDRSLQQAMKRILKISETLGVEVIAEGIDQAEDLETLKELGVPYGQGFLLGRPD